MNEPSDIMLGIPVKGKNALRTIARLVLLFIASGALTGVIDTFVADLSNPAVAVLVANIWAAVLGFARSIVEDKTGKAVLIKPPATLAMMNQVEPTQETDWFAVRQGDTEIGGA